MRAVGTCALLLVLQAAVLTAAADCVPPTVLVDFPVEHAIGAKWNAPASKIAYGRPLNGHYATFVSDLSGAHEQRVRSSAWRDDRHQFPATWHPSGRYLVVTVEKSEHPGSAVDATPGYGGYSDYWIVSADGSRSWKLVEIPSDRDHGITHAAFSPDGTKFVWTERIKAPNLMNANLFTGAYEFNVAAFIDGATPRLGPSQSIVPGGSEQGGEVEAMADDDKTIAFWSTYRTRNVFSSRIYTMNIDTGEITELTTESWSQAPTFTPDGSHIIYMTGAQADIFPWSLRGADWWIMRRDGSNKRRLTYMNKRGNVQSVGQFRLAGSLTFVSDSRFLGDVMTKPLGLTGKIVGVTMQMNCIDQ